MCSQGSAPSRSGAPEQHIVARSAARESASREGRLSLVGRLRAYTPDAAAEPAMRQVGIQARVP
jgi:hypothetical protein